MTAPVDLAARQTSGMTSRLVLAYVEREGGRAAVEAVLDRCDLREHEVYLRDERSWFSFAIKTQLLEAAADVLSDRNVARNLGLAVFEFEAAAGVKAALRNLGSPRLVFELVTRASAKFTRSHTLEKLELADGHAVLRYRDISGVGHHRLDCDYCLGLLTAVPLLFGAPAAQVRHSACVARGKDACLFEVRWQPTSTRRRWLAGATGTAVAMGLGLAVGEPLLPATAAAPAALLGCWARDVARRRRARWASLQAELREERELSRRLSHSLQDIVSDLRPEAVATKITANAQSIIGAKDFALLVEEDGRLKLRSGLGVPPDVIGALEGWATTAARPDDGPLALDDLDDVAPLAALAVVGYGALHATPLLGDEGRLGLLVALGHGPRSFLPRDVLLLERYAAQAALALSNARMVEQLRALAQRDALTGLLNHREFHQALAREVHRAAERDDALGVVLIDLDGFKAVNDGRGHAEGDRVLRRVAAALDAHRPDAGSVYRVGGDEFALLLPGTSADEATQLTERLADAVAALDPDLGASVGLASWPHDGLDEDTLLEHADRLLYDNKRRRSRRIPARPGASPRLRPARGCSSR